jgi:hypothetical protein
MGGIESWNLGPTFGWCICILGINGLLLFLPLKGRAARLACGSYTLLEYRLIFKSITMNNDDLWAVSESAGDFVSRCQNWTGSWTKGELEDRNQKVNFLDWNVILSHVPRIWNYGINHRVFLLARIASISLLQNNFFDESLHFGDWSMVGLGPRRHLLISRRISGFIETWIHW